MGKIVTFNCIAIAKPDDIDRPRLVKSIAEVERFSFNPAHIYLLRTMIVYQRLTKGKSTISHTAIPKGENKATLSPLSQPPYAIQY